MQYLLLRRVNARLRDMEEIARLRDCVTWRVSSLSCWQCLCCKLGRDGWRREKDGGRKFENQNGAVRGRGEIQLTRTQE